MVTPKTSEIGRHNGGALTPKTSQIGRHNGARWASRQLREGIDPI